MEMTNIRHFRRFYTLLPRHFHTYATSIHIQPERSVAEITPN